MTIEQRTLVPLSDVRAVEFECGHCHTTYSIPLTELKPSERAFSCIICPQQFANPSHTDSGDMTDLQVLQGFLMRLCQVQKRNYQATIRLVIPAPVEAKKTT